MYISQKMRCLWFIAILSTAMAVYNGTNVKYDVVYSWKYVDFDWINLKQKEAAIASGNYNKTSVVLYDVDKAPDGRMFVTAVRDKGVPASLMTVTNKMGEGGPLLRPYPHWSWYKNTNCKGIISVYRVFIICNHIFVLDCGKFGEKKVCPARLLIFNLLDNSLVKSVRIPDKFATNKNGTGLLVTPVVYAPHCENILNNAIVYMADTEGYGLVTWNAHRSSFCRTESSFMKPTDPAFTIANKSFVLNDGILGLAIMRSNYYDRLFRDHSLYYAPLAGTNMYKMDSTPLKCYNKNVTDKLTLLAGTLKGQTGPIASIDCAIFFSNIPQTSIMCADSSKPINSNNMDVVAQSAEDLQFPSGLKVYKDKLLTLTNRYQKTVANDDFDTNETNFRIMSIDIGEIKRDTNCFDSCTDEKRIFNHAPWNTNFIW